MIERIRWLREEILKHDRLYDQGKPIISDSEYDRLYQELVQLERDYPELYNPKSPTQKIVFEAVKGLEKVRHSTPILSLEKATTKEELEKFLTRGTGDVIVQEKLDGLTIVITFENGRISDAVSRGNGEVGERLLHNIVTIKSLPKRIFFRGRLVIRGEVYVPYAEFERVNVNGEYSNPRNLASGSVRQLDPFIAAQRGLEIKIFDLIEAEGRTFFDDFECLDFLGQLGFPVVSYEIFSDPKDVINYCLNYSSKRSSLDYAIDGLVIKYSDLSLRESLGRTAKSPRYAIAYKFQSLDAVTTLKEVIWQVGRTGVLTPVAVFDEVDIDGVKISRATLHNPQNIKDKGIMLYDKIVVARANDVIPKVTQALVSERTGTEKEIQIPEKCPVCDSPTRIEGPLVYCTGLNCRPQLAEKIIHFASRDAMDITGLGDSIVELLLFNQLIQSVPDIYKLEQHKNKLMELEGFGKKKVENLLKAVENSKKRPLSAVLYSLSIPHLGKTNSKIIAKKYRNIDSVLTATKEDLAAIEGIGEIMANSITDGLQSLKDTINKLRSLGVNMTEPVEKAGDTLSDKIFVITGTLSKDRSEFKKLIESMGGKVTGSVSKKTTYLLMGNGANGSTKYQDAVKNNVPILNESKFWELIARS